MRVDELICRLDHPLRCEGVVLSFDSKRGWGFVKSGNRDRVFLHRSDCHAGWLPNIGEKVAFYLGYKNGRGRACWAAPSGVE